MYKKIVVVTLVAATALGAQLASAQVTIDWGNFSDTASYYGDPAGPATQQETGGAWTWALATYAGTMADVENYANTWAAGGNSGGLLASGDLVSGGSATWEGPSSAGAFTVGVDDRQGEMGYIIMFDGTDVNSATYFGYIWAADWDIPVSALPTSENWDVSEGSTGIALSPDGGTQIAGATDGWAAVAPSAIPEPGTFALFALGLSALGLRRKMSK